MKLLLKLLCWVVGHEPIDRGIEYHYEECIRCGDWIENKRN
jgi:hypothetical protein